MPRKKRKRIWGAASYIMIRALDVNQKSEFQILSMLWDKFLIVWGRSFCISGVRHDILILYEKGRKANLWNNSKVGRKLKIQLL